jgi:hypothetical protein
MTMESICTKSQNWKGSTPRWPSMLILRLVSLSLPTGLGQPGFLDEMRGGDPKTQPKNITESKPSGFQASRAGGNREWLRQPSWGHGPLRSAHLRGPGLHQRPQLAANGTQTQSSLIFCNWNLDLTIKYSIFLQKASIPNVLKDTEGQIALQVNVGYRETPSGMSTHPWDRRWTPWNDLSSPVPYTASPQTLETFL